MLANLSQAHNTHVIVHENLGNMYKEAETSIQTDLQQPFQGFQRSD